MFYHKIKQKSTSIRDKNGVCAFRMARRGDKVPETAYKGDRCNLDVRTLRVL